MSATKQTDRPTLAPAIAAVLDSLRRRIRRYVWIEGAAAAVAWLGAAFWGSLAIDWFFEPPVAVRVVLLAAVGAALAAILLREIGLRAFVRITDANAAMVLERRFSRLGDSLLTAVGPSGRSTDPEDVDPRMLERTGREAAERIAGLDLRKTFNLRPLCQKCLAAGLLAFSVALFAVESPEGIRMWARRALALADERWPRMTRLEVEGFAGGVEKVARGADLEVVARADTSMPQVPGVVEIRYRTEGGAWGRATMDRRGVAHGPRDRFQEYAYTFRNVLGDIRFDIVGGDDRIDDLRICAVDSPTVSQMTLECRLPDYLGRAVRSMPVSGVMQIPIGSAVTVRAGGANKELVGVEVDRPAEDTSVASLERPESEPEARLADDRRGFVCDVGPVTRDTTLLFTLTDADGIRGRDPVRLMLTPTADQPPRVGVQLDGVGPAVTPQARLPITGVVADDYGLHRVWFDFAIDQQRRPPLVIGEFSDAPTEYETAGAALELRELELRPGQAIQLCVKAVDLYDLGPEPNVAAGQRWQLDVVAPEQLRAMLESRELVLRQRFDRMIEETTGTRDTLARLEFDTPKADDDARRLHVDGALANCTKSAQEVSGLALAFDDLRKQLVNNRIDTEELIARLQAGIAEPLRAIALEMFPELERRLQGLSAALDDAAQAPGLRDRARGQADEILLEMQKIRDRMIELEDFNEAIELLRGIIQQQERLREQIQQRHKQKIRELTED